MATVFLAAYLNDIFFCAPYVCSNVDFYYFTTVLTSSLVVFTLVVPLVLGKIFGGVSYEEARDIPYDFDSVFNAIPKFVHGRFATIFSNHLPGKIVETNYDSGRIVSEQNYKFWRGITAFNLSKVDDTTTRVTVQYTLSYPFDLGFASLTVDSTFAFLRATLSGKRVSVNKGWFLVPGLLGLSLLSLVLSQTNQIAASISPLLTLLATVAIMILIFKKPRHILSDK